MRKPPRCAELLVRASFPGGLLASAHVRGLIVWSLPLVAVLGLGLDLLGLPDGKQWLLSIIAGVVVLTLLALAVSGYAITLSYIVMTDREHPTGRHAQPPSPPPT